MKRVTRPLSIRRLRLDARHIDAEIDQLMWTATYLKYPQAHRCTHNAVIRKAILEAWAIHLRCLIEFFYPNLRHNDTLRATDYVLDRAAWYRSLPKLKNQEHRRLKALHELLAHIAVGRDSRKSRWTERDHRIVARRIPVFLRHAGPTRQRWFPQASRWFADGDGELPMQTM